MIYAHQYAIAQQLADLGVVEYGDALRVANHALVAKRTVGAWSDALRFPKSKAALDEALAIVIAEGSELWGPVTWATALEIAGHVLDDHRDAVPA